MAGKLPGARQVPNPLLPPGKVQPDAQQRVKPLVFFYLRGMALRHGFPVPIPVLVNAAGVRPILACRLDKGEGFGQGIIRSAGPAVLFASRWNIRYQIADPPPAWLPLIPPNPLLDATVT